MTTTDWTRPPTPQPDWRAEAQPQPQGQQVVYVKSGGNGLAITGFVTALLGLLCGFIPVIGFMGAFFWGIFGAVFSFLGINKAKKQPHAGHRGLAVAGVVFACLAFVMGFINVAVTNSAVNEVDKAITKAGQQWSSYSDCMDHVRPGSSTFEQDMDACSALLDD